MAADANKHEHLFSEIVEDLAQTSHGSNALKRLREFFKDTVRKTRQRQQFLLHRLIRAPIIWEDVQNRVWETKEEQEANTFWFLQGDIIQSSHVIEMGEVFSEGTLWIVLSTDCDCARADYVRVGRLYPVFEEQPSDMTDDDYKEQADTLNLALTFRNSKYFPIPPLPGEISAIRGFWADLSTPAHLDFSLNSEFASERILATQVASLTIPAWHIFNALLIEVHTRANLKEAIKIRSVTVSQDTEESAA